jgi:hypothetical protein
VLDREKSRLYFDTTGDTSEDLAEFYEQYIVAMDPDEGTGDCSAMAIGPEHAKGLYACKERLDAMDGKLPFFKVHATGPVSFALTAVDENKRSLYYNDEFRDMVTKALAMKCRWQIQTFAPYAEKIICFIDEPILSAFGSCTYVSVTRDDVVAMVNEVVQAVHQDGALAGIHCCGNTEWSICVDAGVDIMNFDAFDYGDSLAVYPESMTELLDRGGCLAWGLVPSSSQVREQDAPALVKHYGELLDTLTAKGVDRDKLIRQSMVTSSCGTGSMAVEDAEQVFARIRETSALLQEKYQV